MARVSKDQAGRQSPGWGQGASQRAISVRTYVVYAIAGWAIVTVVGAFEIGVVVGASVEVHRLIPPMLVGTVAGLVAARFRALGRRVASQLEIIRASEARILALNETLEERVAARTQQLRAQEEELAEARRVESVGRLAGGLAHDFNNLLTTVLLAADDLDYNLSLGRGAMDVEEVREVTGEITAAARRGAALTRQLLTYARRDEVHPAHFDAREVVKALRPMLARLLGGGVEFTCEVPDDPCPVFMDHGQLEQVIVNLTTNAAEAMAHQGHFTVRLERDAAAGQVRLRVTDDGVGMSEEVQAQAFDAFYTTKEVGRGTGLGLATVHGIVVGAGGHVEVQSHLGEGTTFTVCLPCAPPPGGEPREGEAAAVSLEQPAAVGVSPARAPLVLLVDDEEVVRGVTRRLLKTRGYQVLEAPHGAAALDLMREREGAVDLVVTDRVMPVMGGAALMAELSRSWPSLPVVVVSGHAEEPLPPRPGGAAPLYHVAKPYSARDLFATVARALGG